MSWSDKAVSPVVYTPVPDELSINGYDCLVPVYSRKLATVANGKIVPDNMPPFSSDTCASPVLADTCAAIVLPSGRILLIAYGDGTAGNQLVCLASDDDGINWTKIGSIGNFRVTSIVRNASDGRLVTAQYGYQSMDNGVTWTSANGPAGAAAGIVCDNSGTYLMWPANNWQGVILYRSTNGTSWAAVSGMISVRCAVWSDYAQKFFCVVQDNTVNNRFKIMKSADGLSWEDSSAFSTAYGVIGQPGPANLLNGIASGSLIWFPSGKSCISQDGGVTWNPGTTDVSYGFARAVSFNSGKIIVASFTSGYNNSYAFRISYDSGSNWFYVSNVATMLAHQNTWCPVHLTKVTDRKMYLFAIASGDITARNKLVRSVFDLDILPTATLLTNHSFQPTSPARLATLPTAVLTLDGTGAAGTVALYLQHCNNVIGRWESYSGVPDDDTLASWTSAGAPAASTTTYYLPTLPARAGEQVRARLVFQSTDGTFPAPAFVSLSLSWTSDVAAPVAPTIASIKGVGGANALCNMGSVPAQARHLIAEVNVDGAGFVPFSKRNKVESGHDYMEFLGPKDIDEQAGGRNSIQVLVENLTLGQTVVVRGKAVDDVGNVSSASNSPEITIGGSLPEFYIEDAVVFSGGTANIRVHLVGQTDDEVTVDLATVEGTATDPEHFTGVETTVTFDAGSDELHRWADVEINAVGSDTILGTLNYTVALSNPVGATFERGTGTVTVKGILVQRVPTHRMTFRQRAPMKLVWRQTQ